MLATPRKRWRAEIGRLDGGGRAGTWLADLAAGRAPALSELGEAMRAYYRCAIAPVYPSLRTIVDGDLVVRRGALSTGGVETMLDSFRPMMRWRYPVLELASHPSAREIRLRGRGLCWCRRTSAGCTRSPSSTRTCPRYRLPDQPPARRPGTAGEGLHCQVDRRNRAAVLLAVRDGRTTGELAARVGVSAAAISHHTAILRDADLITSTRAANTVRHSLTRLGHALVQQQPNYCQDAETARPRPGSFHVHRR